MAAAAHDGRRNRGVGGNQPMGPALGLRTAWERHHAERSAQRALVAVRRFAGPLRRHSDSGSAHRFADRASCGIGDHLHTAGVPLEACTDARPRGPQGGMRVRDLRRRGRRPHCRRRASRHRAGRRVRVRPARGQVVPADDAAAPRRHGRRLRPISRSHPGDDPRRRSQRRIHLHGVRRAVGAAGHVADARRCRGFRQHGRARAADSHRGRPARRRGRRRVHTRRGVLDPRCGLARKRTRRHRGARPQYRVRRTADRGRGARRRGRVRPLGGRMADRGHAHSSPRFARRFVRRLGRHRRAVRSRGRRRSVARPVNGRRRVHLREHLRGRRRLLGPLLRGLAPRTPRRRRVRRSRGPRRRHPWRPGRPAAPTARRSSSTAPSTDGSLGASWARGGGS